MKKLLVLALTLSTVFLLSACGSEDGAIKFGVIGPLTGDYSLYGVAVDNGARLAAAEINDFKIDSNIIADLVKNTESSVCEAAAWFQSCVEQPEINDKSMQTSELVSKTIYLGSNPLFQGLKIKELMSAAGSCRLVALAPGEIILHEKTKALGLYIHCSGKLVFEYRLMTDPDDQIAADLFSKGLAGEMQWIDDQDQLYTVKAETACLVLEISGEKFSMLLDDYPLLVLGLCKIYSQRIRNYQQVLSN